MEVYEGICFIPLLHAVSMQVHQGSVNHLLMWPKTMMHNKCACFTRKFLCASGLQLPLTADECSSTFPGMSAFCRTDVVLLICGALSVQAAATHKQALLKEAHARYEAAQGETAGAGGLPALRQTVAQVRYAQHPLQHPCRTLRQNVGIEVMVSLSTGHLWLMCNPIKDFMELIATQGCM